MAYGYNVAYGNSRGSINVLNTVIGRQKYTIPAHKGSISSLAYTSCGRFLVSGSCENKGNLVTNAIINLIHSMIFCSICTVKIWCSSDVCNIFNFDTKDQITSVCTHPQHPHLLAFSTRGNAYYM